MITSAADWRRAWDALGITGLPEEPGLGEHYPWRTVVLHAATAAHRRRVEIARERVLATLAEPVDWRLAWSAGKDSTALAALVAEVGGMVLAFGEKDDMDYPGETEYLGALGARLGIPVDVIRPPVSLAAELRRLRVDLTEDLHGKAAEMSREHFYGLLAEHRAREGYGGVLWGLRAEESSHRAVNRATHGWRYRRRSDGLETAAPIADWTSLDVHAYLASRNVPLLPLYLCIEPGMDAMALRKSWFVVGGGPARFGGHYNWLRRWWPEQWALAASISPSIRSLS